MRMALHDPALSVCSAPARASPLPKGAEVQHTMWGCFASKLICRTTLPRSIAAALDIIVLDMARWVDALGAAVVKKTESLVCFRGVHPATGSRRDIVCLLIFSRILPTIHFYAMCDIQGVPPEGDVLETMPEALPFVASIGLGPCRMSNRWRSIDVKTNEEVALEMARTHMEWRIVPLKWCLAEGASPLLDHVATKVEDVFVATGKVARHLLRDADDIIDQLAADPDPFATGVRAATMADAASSGAPPRHLGVPPTDSILALGEAGAEAELFADMADDVVDDLHLMLFGEPPPLDDLGVAPSDDDGLAEEDDAAEEGVPEAGVTGEEDGTAAAGAPPAPDPLDEAVANCTIDRDTGEVTCSLPPWNAMVKIGRITTWPEWQKDKQLRSISCQCYMHSNCRSPARVVRRCRRDTLLRWLLAGKLLQPAYSIGQRREWGTHHPPSFLGIFAAAPAPSPPPTDAADSAPEVKS